MSGEPDDNDEPSPADEVEDGRTELIIPEDTIVLNLLYKIDGCVQDIRKGIQPAPNIGDALESLKKIAEKTHDALTSMDRRISDNFNSIEKLIKGKNKDDKNARDAEIKQLVASLQQSLEENVEKGVKKAVKDLEKTDKEPPSPNKRKRPSGKKR